MTAPTHTVDISQITQEVLEKFEQEKMKNVERNQRLDALIAEIIKSSTNPEEITRDELKKLHDFCVIEFNLDE